MVSRSLVTPQSMLATCLLGFACGCATWLPTNDEPPPIKPSFGGGEISKDAVGIETILVRLDSNQAAHLDELWAQVDEQILSPEKRFALDRNGMRAGKIGGTLPKVLEDWIRESEKRLEDDPLEQTGLAADTSSYSQLWRCRPNSKKELTIRNITNEKISIFYNDGAAKGRAFDSPHFIYDLQAVPFGDTSATIRLTPEVQHGELIRRVVAREAALRTDTHRESIHWDQLAVELRVNRGDCIIVGGTMESRCLGEHFFHCVTKDGERQPVILVVRLTETRLDDVFAPNEVAKVKRTLELR